MLSDRHALKNLREANAALRKRILELEEELRSVPKEQERWRKFNYERAGHGEREYIASTP